MKIQYTCCCGSKFIGITEIEKCDADHTKIEMTFICAAYEKFKTRHASCHKKNNTLRVFGEHSA